MAGQTEAAGLVQRLRDKGFLRQAQGVTFGPIRSLGTPPDDDTEIVECDVFRGGVKVGGITTDREGLESEMAAVRAEIEEAN